MWAPQPHAQAHTRGPFTAPAPRGHLSTPHMHAQAFPRCPPPAFLFLTPVGRQWTPDARRLNPRARRQTPPRLPTPAGPPPRGSILGAEDLAHGKSESLGKAHGLHGDSGGLGAAGKGCKGQAPRRGQVSTGCCHWSYSKPPPAVMPLPRSGAARVPAADESCVPLPSLH